MSLTAQPNSLVGIMRVKNHEPNSTVFSKVVDGNSLKILFAAAGYDGDVQRVPVSLAQDIDFLNSLENGVLEVIDAPEDIMASLQFETSRSRAERVEADARHIQMVDRRQDRDMVGATCVGPAPTGRIGECKRPLLQTSKQAAENPPLCKQHEMLAPNYYLAVDGSKGENSTEAHDGIVRREWKTVTLNPTQKV